MFVSDVYKQYVYIQRLLRGLTVIKMEGSNGEKEVQSAQYTISDSTSSSDEDGPDVYVPTFTIPFDSVTLGETSATRVLI